APPATLAEFTLSPTDDAFDYYDVSLVDGFNLPVKIQPTGGCPVADCPVDLVAQCPYQLGGPNQPYVGTIGCMSPCQANVDGNQANSPNCCSGSFSTPETCPSSGVAYYSYFKGNCPNSWVYAFDEASGTALWTCAGSNKANCKYDNFLSVMICDEHP
ncbi:hypothetical protein FRC06_002752, partial [Ceratobasidium sp. 370]